jgi:hypothetical protein
MDSATTTNAKAQTAAEGVCWSLWKLFAFLTLGVVIGLITIGASGGFNATGGPVPDNESSTGGGGGGGGEGGLCPYHYNCNGWNLNTISGTYCASACACINACEPQCCAQNQQYASQLGTPCGYTC